MAVGLEAIKEPINRYWESLDKKQKRNLLIIAGVVIIAIFFLASVAGKKDYVVLYSGLNTQEAAEIYTRLKELDVNPKLRGSSVILVPKDKEPEIRMQLAAEGYPKSGFNYDLFLENSSFSRTDAEKRALLTWQLQERLIQCIKILEGVEDAVVNIGMPEADSYVLKSQQVPVTASVIIKPKPGWQITPKQAKNIEQLIAKSVPGLKEENITIIDTNMNILNASSDAQSDIVNNQFDLEHQLEERIRERVIGLLEPVFGYKKVVATVNVKLNFDKKIKESVTFEPVKDDNGIIVSMEELKEKIKNGRPEGVAGEATNTTEYPTIAQEGSGSYEKEQKTVNYEVNEIKEKIEEQQGKIEDLSISVIIDNENLDSQTLDQVKELVAMAIGTDLNRVVVYNMKFDTSLQEKLLQGFEESKQKEEKYWFDRNTLLIVGGGLALLIFIIVMMRVTRKKAVEETTGEVVSEVETTAEEEIKEIVQETDERNKIKKYVEKFANQNPEAVAQLLRNWLSEE